MVPKKQGKTSIIQFKLRWCRRCPEEMVKQKKLKKALEEVDKHREALQKKYGVMTSSADFIRWDREHGHT